jgi:hypothetical protein
MSIFKLQHGMAGHKMVLRRSNMRKRMSALGHQQTFRDVRVASALQPKADIHQRLMDVRFGPFSDSCIAARVSTAKATALAVPEPPVQHRLPASTQVAGG